MIQEIIKKNGVTFGLIAGSISVLTTTLIYAIDLKLFTAWWIGIINMSLYTIIAILLLIKTKKELNNLFPFKDAFTTYFISALTAIILSVTFNIILFNIIDPEAKAIIEELTVKYITDTMSSFGTPASAIEEAAQNIRESEQFSVTGLLKGALSNLVFSIIFGLILAAFFKNKPSRNEFK